MKTTWNFNDIQMGIHWISSWNFNEIKMEINLQFSWNSMNFNEIPVGLIENPVEISIKYKWKSIGNQVTILINYQMTSIGSPVKIHLEI